MNLQPYFNFAKQLAYRAGWITLGHYNKGIQHDFKSDESPVTAADRLAREIKPAAVRRIDTLVYDLYGLSPDEIKIVEGKE